MKFSSLFIILFLNLPVAFGAYPSFVKPQCILGLDWKVEQAVDKQGISSFHEDNLFREVAFELTSKKNYYLLILENHKAPQQLIIIVKPQIVNENEISCQATKIFGTQSLTTVTSGKLQSALPISRQLYDLCRDQIIGNRFTEIPVCK